MDMYFSAMWAICCGIAVLNYVNWREYNDKKQRCTIVQSEVGVLFSLQNAHL